MYAKASVETLVSQCQGFAFLRKILKFHLIILHFDFTCVFFLPSWLSSGSFCGLWLPGQRFYGIPGVWTSGPLFLSSLELPSSRWFVLPNSSMWPHYIIFIILRSLFSVERQKGWVQVGGEEELGGVDGGKTVIWISVKGQHIYIGQVWMRKYVF